MYVIILTMSHLMYKPYSNRNIDLACKTSEVNVLHFNRLEAYSA